MLFRITILVFAGILVHSVDGADCDLSQQRQSDFPSGQQIANALTKQGALDNVCSDDFADQQQSLIKIYNEGSVNYNITRKTTDEAPSDNNCLAGFQNIIDQCIVNSNYWGGTYTFNDFTYAVSNAAYPSNGLPSWDATPSPTPGSGTVVPTAAAGSNTAGSETTSLDQGSTTAAPGSTQSSNGTPVTSVSGETILTETNSAGSQVVATFAPTTFTQYTDLTSSTTITSSTTDSNGAPLLIPVVVGAGGIAWVIIGGVPPPGITPPGGVPGGGEGGDGNPTPTVTVSNTGSPSSTFQSSSASASSSDGPSVTAIGDPEYGDIGGLQAAIIDPAGPVPDDDSGAVTSSAASTNPPSTTLTTTTSQPVSPTSTPTDSGPCQDDCTAIIPQLSVYGDLICSGDDFGKFIDSGTTTDPNGEADWFRISSHGNCYLVMAKSAAHRGFPDQYCFQKSAVIDFVNQNALGCNVGDPFLRTSGAQRPGSQFSGSGEVCLANFKNYQSCGEADL